MADVESGKDLVIALQKEFVILEDLFIKKWKKILESIGKHKLAMELGICLTRS